MGNTIAYEVQLQFYPDEKNNCFVTFLFAFWICSFSSLQSFINKCPMAEAEIYIMIQKFGENSGRHR